MAPEPGKDRVFPRASGETSPIDTAAPRDCSQGTLGPSRVLFCFGFGLAFFMVLRMEHGVSGFMCFTPEPHSQPWLHRFSKRSSQ